MDAKAQQNLERAVTALFHQLNQGKDSGEYYFNTMPGTPYAFSIMRKMPAGSAGPRYVNYKGITHKQCAIIESTSQSVAEMTERIRAFIIDGKDTTRGQENPLPASVDAAMIERIVNERLNKILAERGPQPQNQGLVDKTRKPRKAANAESLAIWQKRAELLGIPAPPTKKDGSIDGRWVLKVRPRWEAYEQSGADAVDADTAHATAG